jgi:hypothetical protein
MSRQYSAPGEVVTDTNNKPSCHTCSTPLIDLGLADCAPRRLWDAALYEPHKRLMAAVDALNIKFGKDAVRCGLFPSSVSLR